MREPSYIQGNKKILTVGSREYSRYYSLLEAEPLRGTEKGHNR